MKELAEIKHTMSSLEIAELTGKSHDYLLKAIRKMEPAWLSVTGVNFDETFIVRELGNGGFRKDPCYQLTKRECLYIATKFNDEARAKLVIRWEQLEKPEKPFENPLSDLESLAEHTKRPVQVLNSKKINGHLIRNWDVETAIKYNREHCRLVTGIEPNQVKKIGKEQGLKSAERTSAKEVLRHIKPELAAQMSINDYLVEHGRKLKAANSLTQPCVPLLNELIEVKRLKA